MNHSGLSGWLPIVPLFALLAVYLYGVYVQKKVDQTWNGWRTSAFTVGILLLTFGLISPVMQHAHRNFEVHMMQHLLLGMLAPFGLVLAEPVTLALRCLPTQNARGLTAIAGIRPFHYLSHPITALFLNIGGMYLLYLTPLYIAMHHNSFIHIFWCICILYLQVIFLYGQLQGLIRHLKL